MPIIKLPTDFKADIKSNVADLHTVLTKLNLPLPEQTKAAKKVDASTIEAVKKF